MSSKKNFIYSIVSFVATIGFVFLVILLSGKKYVDNEIGHTILWFVIGAIFVGIFSTFFHELGHLILGKKNGFKLISFYFWFFKWSLKGDKYKFNFAFLGEEFGATEMISTTTENMEKRFYNLTLGGPLFSFFLFIIGIPCVFLTFLPFELYAILSMILPINTYIFLGNALPSSMDGVRNDGGVLYGLKKNDDVSKNTISLLKIHTELFLGKSPKEITKEFLFEVPQLPEDDLNFLMILQARYNYYLDLNDYEKAREVLERLESLEEYMPKDFYSIIKAESVYAYSTYMTNLDKADMCVYEIEKFLNNNNSPLSIRAKLAYILATDGVSEKVEVFYKKGLKECSRLQILGLQKFESRLLEKLKEKF